MKMEISGKVAVVTGASSGIGLATARLLAKEGAKVVLAARSKDKLQKLSQEMPGSLSVVADMTRESDIRNMIEQAKTRFGRIDILVNNAGQGYDSPVEKIDITTFSRIFLLDVVGPLIAMEQVIPLMRKQGGGMITNISSGTALMHLPDMAAYSSMKRALAGISLTAREELKKDNIVVNVVYPFATSTDFEKNTIRNPGMAREYEGGAPYQADSAEHVAGKIVDGIRSGEAEVFAHDWMKKLAAGGSRPSE
jgi:short-subunit dehydrogenase